MDKSKVILQAVKSLKKSQFGGGVTAIKVELEAQFDRGQTGGCGEDHECPECEGNWENFEECIDCNGLGYFRRRQGNNEWESCSYDEYGEVHNAPSAWETAECDECLGAGTYSCHFCEEGYRDCNDYCEAEAEDNRFAEEANCHDFMMEKLAELGLAEDSEGNDTVLSHGVRTNWQTIAPLTYAEFYRDGSVDSEFTFTIMLDNPENIFLLPKVIAIWNELGQAIGNGVNVRGAGMHTALLNTRNGSYGDSYSYTATDLTRFNNFRSSMQLLLPALYCLGASNNSSRGLNYRQPSIGRDSHRAAVDYRYGALEFRIFDTCYDNPDQILDNVVVISKCMRYWSNTRVPNGLAKITNQITFGDKGGQELDRFYCRIEHIDLLNQGLRKLKPSYYTISDIKRQRQMKINKRAISTKVRQFRKQAETEYAEYLDRFKRTMLVTRHRRIADVLEMSGKQVSVAAIETEVEEYIQQRESERQTVSQYVEQRVGEFNNTRGEYTLCAE